MRNPKTLVRILIVDDHPAIRFGLQSLLSQEPGFEVCGQADNAREATKLFNERRPDVVIVDISLSEGNGLDLIKQLSAGSSHCRFLVVSLHDEKLYAERALSAGAAGYVSKKDPLDRIVAAVRRIATGHLYFSQEVAELFLRKYAGGPMPEPSSSEVSCLSKRELEVFELIGRGCETSEIATQLFISPKTVSTHYENIKHKLGLDSKTELVRHAVTWLNEEN
jgi:DNA-binding NarL/FixJ family response regulator